MDRPGDPLDPAAKVTEDETTSQNRSITGTNAVKRPFDLVASSTDEPEPPKVAPAAPDALDKRLMVFEDIDTGRVGTLKELASKYDMPLHTVNNWLYNREMIEEEASQDETLSGLRKVNYFEVELNLVEECMQLFEENVELTKIELMAKARRIATTLQMNNFVCSAFWLECFMKRFFIRTVMKNGDFLQCNLNDLKYQREQVAQKKARQRRELENEISGNNLPCSEVVHSVVGAAQDIQESMFTKKMKPSKPVGEDQEPETASTAKYHCEKCKIRDELLTKGPIWQCTLCCELLVTERSLTEHLQKVHPTKIIVCPMSPACRYICISRSAFNEHALKCSVISSRLQKKDALDSNLVVIENSTQKPHCHRCETHQILSTIGKLYKCDFCCELLFMANSATGLQMHMLQRHPAQALRCKNFNRCKFFTFNKSKLNEHVIDCNDMSILSGNIKEAPSILKLQKSSSGKTPKSSPVTSKCLKTCPKCKKSLAEWEKLRKQHRACRRLVHGEPFQFQCVHCPVNCVLQEMIKAHQKCEHGAHSCYWAVCTGCKEELLVVHFDAHRCVSKN